MRKRRAPSASPIRRAARESPSPAHRARPNRARLAAGLTWRTVAKSRLRRVSSWPSVPPCSTLAMKKPPFASTSQAKSAAARRARRCADDRSPDGQWRSRPCPTSRRRRGRRACSDEFRRVRILEILHRNSTPANGSTSSRSIATILPLPCFAQMRGGDLAPAARRGPKVDEPLPGLKRCSDRPSHRAYRPRASGSPLAWRARHRDH